MLLVTRDFDDMSDSDYRQLYLRMRGSHTDRWFVRNCNPGFSHGAAYKVAAGDPVPWGVRQKLRKVAGLPELPDLSPVDDGKHDRYAIRPVGAKDGRRQKREKYFRPCLPIELRNRTLELPPDVTPEIVYMVGLSVLGQAKVTP